MATYAIGDVQGCFTSLQQLLSHIRFEPTRDRLWFVGDLVNRGPDSLGVLRYVKELGPAAVTVLGNHDLFLLAAASGIAAPRAMDTIQPILAAPDRDELLAWLRCQPLLYREGPFTMVHAGLLPQWTIEQAEGLAREVETVLAGPDYQEVLRASVASPSVQWSDDLTGLPRLASLAHVFTRLRTCTVDGMMSTSYNGPPDHAPSGFLPWLHIPTRRSSEATIVCGHWAALGLYLSDNVLALDSGCVWGRELTAVRLENRQVFQVPCNSEDCPGY
ncbi:MAG: symmetrical bis(5'-nucleosyl)-tetraphosphatase [Nitrospirae bacterium]|nr:symmetrical bis(5'-nucleosyl)-tetraphosphatase [Nitrospirota bacterium]